LNIKVINGGTYEARTTSRPQGDIDIEPTGLSTSNDPSFSKVGLVNAEADCTTSASRVIDIAENKMKAQLKAEY